MTTMWIYEDINRRCYIAKRDPIFHYVPRLNMKTGEIDIHISQGIEINIPKWEWIQTKNEIIWGKYAGIVYDITDINMSNVSDVTDVTDVTDVANGKTENSTLKQEGPA